MEKYHLYLFDDSEGGILACFMPCVTQPRFLQSVTNTVSCRLCCLPCRHGNSIFAFIPFFNWQHGGGGGKVVNIKENSAAKLSDGKTGHFVCKKSNVAAQ